MSSCVRYYPTSRGGQNYQFRRRRWRKRTYIVIRRLKTQDPRGFKETPNLLHTYPRLKLGQSLGTYVQSVLHSRLLNLQFGMRLQSCSVFLSCKTEGSKTAMLSSGSKCHVTHVWAAWRFKMQQPMARVTNSPAIRRAHAFLSAQLKFMCLHSLPKGSER